MVDATRRALRQKRWAAIYQVALLACIAYPVLNRDPFGALSITERYSQDLFNVALGHWRFVYPHKRWAALDQSGGAAGIDRKAGTTDDAAVVLLLNESALDARGERWPASLRFHAQVLEELATFGPRAIFVDFLMVQAQPADDRVVFARTLSTLQKEGVRTYMAVTTADDLALVLPQPGETGEPADDSRIGPISLTPVSVRKLSDGSDFVNRRYPGWDTSSSAAPRGTARPRSAAFAIYCDEVPAAPACSDLEARRLAGDDYSFDLIWGVAPHPANQSWNAGACHEMNRIRQSVMGSGVGAGATPGCVHIATLFAQTLLGGAGPAGGLSNAELESLLEGRTVFYGGNYRASGDLVHTGIHTTLPGIYYHAMAYDNLVAFEGRPKVRREYRRDGFLLAIYDLLVLLSLSSLFVLRQRALVRLDRQGTRAVRDEARPLERWAVALSAIPTGLLVLGACSVLVLIGLNPQWRALTLVIAAAVALGVEVAGRPRQPLGTVLARGLVTAISLAVSAAVIGLAVYIAYRWLALPPLDWIKYLAFATFGFFLANLVLVEFIERLVHERSKREVQS